MSDSTENTNELDSYGVWVKNTKQDENTDDALNFADSLDLPEFEENDTLEDTDFADIFTDSEDTGATDFSQSSDDTTLTDDELMNITSGDGIEIAEATEDASIDIDDTSLDDISFDSLEENSVSDSDLSNFDTVEITDDAIEPEAEVEETVEAEAPVEEPVFDETPVEEAPAEETADFSVEDFDIEDTPSTDESGSEEEVSLDDFMDGGFSDESVASGNNGFAADAAPASSDSEEVSLDDFVDMSEFGVTEEAPKKEEAIADEKPLDMDISFDSSADAIQTEEVAPEETLEDDFAEEEIIEEDIPVQEEEEEIRPEGGNDIEAEEVDLSDFGIDENAEETPVTQDVESAKNKEAVVDYDLSVGDANMNAAPVVNEIKSNTSSNIEEIEEILEEPEPVVSESDSSLLKQIVDDLSNLKQEINTLKTNLDEIMANPAPRSEASGVISEEIAVEETFEDDSAKEDTGFFSGDDGDDTIALSTDELSNILNTADFSEETVEAEAPSEEAVEEPGDAIDEIAFDSIDDETKEIEYDFTDENLSEPNIDEIEIDEEALDEDLPDEITISKEDDILVESSSSDFMDSVQDSTEEHETEAEIPVTEEAPAAEEEFSTVDNLFDEAAAPAEEANGFADIEVEEPVDNTIDEETFVPEEEVVEEEIVQEEPVEESIEPPVEDIPVPEIENDFVSHEDDNNNLTDSNIDYLTTEEAQPEVDADENAELKKDIKSVLLYMDQLLENLPEEKIVEFAKSDEFTTYKKLFSELGLS